MQTFFPFYGFKFMDIIIYIGIAVNIIGALLLMFYAFRYYGAGKSAGRLSIKVNDLKARWQKKRALGFGLMIGGLSITIIGCYL